MNTRAYGTDCISIKMVNHFSSCSEGILKNARVQALQSLLKIVIWYIDSVLTEFKTIN